jgi:hypothetical protein
MSAEKRTDRRDRLPSWRSYGVDRWSRMTPNGDGAHIFVSDYGTEQGKKAVISVHFARRHIGNYDVPRMPRETQEDQFARARMLAEEMMVRVGIPSAEVLSDRWSVDQDVELMRRLPLLSALLAAGMVPNDIIRELVAALLQSQSPGSKWRELNTHTVGAAEPTSFGAAT